MAITFVDLSAILGQLWWPFFSCGRDIFVHAIFW